MVKIYVDADACPVKDEVYRVAQRYGLRVVMVSNAWLRTPNEEWLELVVVGAELDAADAWIVEHVTADDVVAWRRERVSSDPGDVLLQRIRSAVRSPHEN